MVFWSPSQSHRETHACKKESNFVVFYIFSVKLRAVTSSTLSLVTVVIVAARMLYNKIHQNTEKPRAYSSSLFSPFCAFLTRIFL